VSWKHTRSFVPSIFGFKSRKIPQRLLTTGRLANRLLGRVARLRLVNLTRRSRLVINFRVDNRLTGRLADTAAGLLGVIAPSGGKHY